MTTQVKFWREKSEKLERDLNFIRQPEPRKRIKMTGMPFNASETDPEEVYLLISVDIC